MPPSCGLSGFWEIDQHIVARFYRVDMDLGNLEYIGRGQCVDRNGRSYGGWATDNVAAGVEVCNAAAGCVGIELKDAGGCVLRYDADELPYDPPEGLPGAEYVEGDDAFGRADATAGPWARSCWVKPADGAADEPQREDPTGGFWRVLFYTRDGTWPLWSYTAKGSRLDVGDAPLEGLPDCDGEGGDADLLDALPPFVHEASIWRGANEINFWAGRPRAEPRWRAVPDAAAWDPAASAGGSACKVAEGVQHLPGRRLSIQHALWGIRSCSAAGFQRISPELVGLDEEGWEAVVSYSFRLGVDIFLRRLLAHKGRAIADEDCFKEFISDLWGSLATTSFAAVSAAALDSQCMATP